MVTRHTIREKAFQALFALNSNPDGDREAIYRELLEVPDEESAVIPPYLEALVSGVSDKQAEIDSVIEENLTSRWKLSRLNNTDLIILRLAIYEMKYVDDVPAKVALNEALEIAKEFSDDESRKFVNGVLDPVVEKMPVDIEKTNE
ncbi:transcription antitermination factor NusB [Dellaglioa sp. P0083]|uniref:transcription antitermination factor NusB n=1 Tax=Dellaglioa kimchii TaxID=3344667 RepID=UPI0038D36469